MAARATEAVPVPASLAVPLIVFHDFTLVAARGLAMVTTGPAESTVTAIASALVLEELPASSRATTLGVNVPAAA